MSDKSDYMFAGSIPELYDRYLVPLIFEPYAADLVVRLRRLEPSSILEVAAGTGVVTRAMAAGLSNPTHIVGTDFNQPMVDHAENVGTDQPVEWRQADVVSLPFDDVSFDAVVCQFGVMFFPDRERAFAEVRRVLKPGGTFLFNTWDRLATNDFARVVTDAVAAMFPDDPPAFLDRTPHGYHDERVVQKELRAGGFATPAAFESLEARSWAESPDEPAIAYCQGTPLRNEIEARDPTRLSEATTVSAHAIEELFGSGPVDGLTRGFVVTASNPVTA